MAKTTDDIIRDGKRIESFLADEEVMSAFSRLEQRYIADMREAKDSDTVLRIHAKFAVIADLQRDLRAVRDSGKVAQAEVVQREKREAPRPQRTR